MPVLKMAGVLCVSGKETVNKVKGFYSDSRMSFYLTLILYEICDFNGNELMFITKLFNKNLVNPNKILIKL